MKNNDFLKYLSEEYETKMETIKKYYDILLEFPFINEDDEKFEECLESIVSDRISKLKGDTIQGVRETINKWVYKVYQDEIQEMNTARDEDFYDEEHSANNIRYQ